MPKPKGILFDLGGTLLAQEGFDLAAGARRLVELAGAGNAVSAFQVAELARELTDEIQPRCEESMIEFGTRSFLRLLQDTLGLALRAPAAELEAEFWKHAVRMRPEPGAAEMLADLAGRGPRLAVLSNSTFGGDVLAAELGRHGLLKPFRFVMSSADYGFRKPHPLLFSTAVARLGLAPPDIWYVGDLPRYDVTGAQNAGLVSVWYNPRGDRLDGVQPDHEVRAWNEFADLAAAALNGT